MPKRKLRYVPGLISMIGLPILIFIFPVVDPSPIETSFWLTLPANNNHHENIFTDEFLRSKISTKKVVRVYLSGSSFHEHDELRFVYKAKYNFIEKELERLSFSGDTTIALQVEFTPENTYEDWIKVQNLAMLYHVRAYSFFENSFYFFSNPPEKARPQETLDYIEPIEVNIESPQYQTKWDLFFSGISWRCRAFTLLVKDNLLVSISFMILIFIPWMFWIRRNLRKSVYPK